MNGIRVDQRIRCDYRDSYADTEYRLCDKEQRRDESLHEPIHEQVGRYAGIVFMWLPLIVWKFGFASVFEMVLYLACNGTLLAAYWISFAVYMKHRTAQLALILAILPSCIFLFSGILLRHWLLVSFAVLFAVGHIYVTYKNAVFTKDRN